MTASFYPNLFKLDGAVAIVTGGASGIGLATVQALAEAWASVTIFDRADPPARSDAAHAIAIDVSDPAAVKEAFRAVADREGRLDILVNSAGMAIREPALDLPLEHWDKVVAVN